MGSTEAMRRAETWCGRSGKEGKREGEREAREGWVCRHFLGGPRGVRGKERRRRGRLWHSWHSGKKVPWRLHPDRPSCLPACLSACYSVSLCLSQKYIVKHGERGSGERGKNSRVKRREL